MPSLRKYGRGADQVHGDVGDVLLVRAYVEGTGFQYHPVPFEGYVLEAQAPEECPVTDAHLAVGDRQAGQVGGAEGLLVYQPYGIGELDLGEGGMVERPPADRRDG